MAEVESTSMFVTKIESYSTKITSTAGGAATLSDVDNASSSETK